MLIADNYSQTCKKKVYAPSYIQHKQIFMHFRSSDFSAGSFLSTTILVILVVVFFIIGMIGGLTVGALVVYGCFKWKLSHQSKHRLPPSSPPPPAALYEDIEISTVKCEVNENVAYGITSQIT